MAQWHRTVFLEAYELLGLRKVYYGLGKEIGEVTYLSLSPIDQNFAAGSIKSLPFKVCECICLMSPLLI